MYVFLFILYCVFPMLKCRWSYIYIYICVRSFSSFLDNDLETVPNWWEDALSDSSTQKWKATMWSIWYYYHSFVFFFFRRKKERKSMKQMEPMNTKYTVDRWNVESYHLRIPWHNKYINSFFYYYWNIYYHYNYFVVLKWNFGDEDRDFECIQWLHLSMPTKRIKTSWKKQNVKIKS